MLNALNTLWTVLFVACLHLPFAAVVSGLIGPQNGVTFWFMAMAAHWPMRSVTNLSLGRRLTIWSTAVAVGIASFVALATTLGTVTVNLVFSGHVPLKVVPWLGFAIGLAPVIAAGSVSGILVRRAVRPGDVASPRAATRQSTPDFVEVQKQSGSQAAETPARSLRARATLPTGAGRGHNWKNGLLRLWLAINLPLIAYSGYSIYSNHKCEEWWHDQVLYWQKSMREHEAARDRGMFDFASASFDRSADSRDACKDSRESAVGALEIVPAGSAAVMLAGLWVARGFRNRPSTRA